MDRAARRLPARAQSLPGLARDFSLLPTRGPAPAPVLARLRVSAPGDRYEQEADRIADAVMRVPTSARTLPLESGLDRPDVQLQEAKVDPVGEAGEQAELMAVDRPVVMVASRGAREEPEALQRKPSDTRPALGSPSSGGTVPLGGGSGRPLPSAVRTQMEPRVGADFSSVRIHTDLRADGLCRSLGARAFTHRNHIFFAADEYEPTSSEGQRLIAHELVHTLQQNATGPSDIQRTIDTTIRVEQVDLTALQGDAIRVTPNNPFGDMFRVMQQQAYGSFMRGNPGFLVETEDTWYYYRPLFHSDVVATRSQTAASLTSGDLYFQAATDLYKIAFRYRHTRSRGPIEGLSLSFRSGSRQDRKVSITGGAKATFDFLELSASATSEQSRGTTQESGVASTNVFEHYYDVIADYQLSYFLSRDFESGFFGTSQQATQPRSLSGTVDVGTITVYDDTNTPDNLTP